ncbi:elongation factor P [Membranihabitans maritimus]|uniref:elongation factor P n=1 Tax=Membranihabitans maritimus TaxID=2904244 RepID=UPI001EFFFA17|nr:elongation factor P [Membranihabitans maritimus]
MANTSDIRKGLCIDFNNDLFQIIEFQHVKPGKGNAFVRTKLKSITTGKVLDHTFPAGHSIDPVRVERRVFQYLYADEFAYHFMNNETYEQVGVNKEMVENSQFMKEGSDVEILFHAAEERPLVVELPQNVVLEVIYTEPGVKGDTATNTLKPAKVETEAEVRVPLFINQGDLVKIDTETGNYIERVKQ